MNQTNTDERPTILVVDDEPGMRSLFADFLAEDYDVVTTGSGQAALEAIDDAIDLVLLDRRMPGLSGDEVLSEIRNSYDCPIAMVTAIEPELDTVDLPFDDYITKPITKQELNEVVESLLARFEYGDAVRVYFEILSKIAILDEHEPEATLAESREYAELLERLEVVKEDARAKLDDAIAAGRFETLLRSLKQG